MNISKYTVAVSYLPVRPGAFIRSLNVSYKWDDDGLNVCIETVSPERTGEFCDYFLPMTGDISEIDVFLTNLHRDLTGAVMWSERTVLDFQTAMDMSDDLSTRPLLEVIEEYRFHVTDDLLTHYREQARVVLSALVDVLAGENDNPDDWMSFEEYSAALSASGE